MLIGSDASASAANVANTAVLLCSPESPSGNGKTRSVTLVYSLLWLELMVRIYTLVHGTQRSQGGR